MDDQGARGIDTNTLDNVGSSIKVDNGSNGLAEGGPDIGRGLVVVVRLGIVDLAITKQTHCQKYYDIN